MSTYTVICHPRGPVIYKWAHSIYLTFLFLWLPLRLLAKNMNPIAGHSGSRDRKRLRVEYEEPEIKPQADASTSNSVNPVVRDTEYYRHGGDCIFRVEDTLFKANTTLLSCSFS